MTQAAITEAVPMKTIGLLGGTAWVSTIEYYRRLNRLAQDHFGEWHSAPLLLRSIDYAPIVSRYGDDWAGARDRFAVELAALEAMGPDCLLVCCNTLHKALDELPAAHRPQRPVIHMVDETARAALKAGTAACCCSVRGLPWKTAITKTDSRMPG